VEAGLFEEYRAEVSPQFARVVEAADAIRPLEADTRVYVMGNPLIYVVLDTLQPLAVNAWSLEFFTPADWARLEDEFTAAPPDAVFVAQYYTADVAAEAPRISAMLAEDFAVAAQVPSGTWYRR